MFRIDINKVRKYLSQVNLLTKEMHSLQMTLAELEAEAGVKATDYSALRVQSAHDPHSQMDMVAIKAWELMETIQRRQDKIFEIHSVINAVPNPLHRVILIEYYLNQRTWNDVWEYLHYKADTGYTRSLQHDAVLSAGKVMEEKGISIE